MDTSDIDGMSGTPAEILATLQADPRHRQDVPMSSLMDVLINGLELLTMTPENGFNGPLSAAVQSSGNPSLIKGFNRLLANAQMRPASTVHTATDPATGALATGLTDLAKAAEPQRADTIQAAMDGLTGGRKFAEVTEQDVFDAVSLKAKEDALRAVDLKATAVIEAANEEFREAGSTAESIASAAESAWGE